MRPTGTHGCSPRKRPSPLKPTATTSLMLKSPCYSDKILGGLALLRDSGLLTDITLVADGSTVFVFIIHN